MKLSLKNLPEKIVISLHTKVEVTIPHPLFLLLSHLKKLQEIIKRVKFTKRQNSQKRAALYLF